MYVSNGKDLSRCFLSVCYSINGNLVVECQLGGRLLDHVVLELIVFPRFSKAPSFPFVGSH